MKPTKLRSCLEFISSLVKNYFRVDLSSLGAANSGLFARTKRIKMPERILNKQKSPIKYLLAVNSRQLLAALAVAVLLGACGDKEAQETQSLLQCSQFREICEIAFGSFGRRTRFAWDYKLTCELRIYIFVSLHFSKISSKVRASPLQKCPIFWHFSSKKAFSSFFLAMLLARTINFAEEK